MGQARKHHYVSQFYLKRFTANPSKPRLFVVDIIERKTFTADPKNVAFEKDFHTIDVSGQPSDVVEKMLARIEGDVAEAFKRIVNSCSLSNENDRAQLLHFATILLVNNPAQRAIMNALVTLLMTTSGREQASDPATFTAHVQEMIATGGMPPDTDIEELRRSLLTENFDISMGTASHLNVGLNNVPDLLPYLLDRKWHIYRAVEGHFVTSDRPVSLMWADPSRTGPVGLGLRDTRVLFPLSSTIAIYGGFELTNDVIELALDKVAAVNARTILNATRQVYARESDFMYALQHNGGPRDGSALLSDQYVVRRAERANGDALAAAKSQVRVVSGADPKVLDWLPHEELF
ncbi:MAG TPA: DUF4238 domain-containing protein [Candidatus Elarobacter sp.]|jgi:hypothetical protein|nr:DUF4238 domain-containing protein [Candidatus Elarobacter sp.]